MSLKILFDLWNFVTQKTFEWCRWTYINIIRIGLGQAKMSKITDISVLYKNEHFIVVNKREDIKINSDNPRDYITVSTQLKYLFPNTYSDEVAHGYRFIHRLDYATSGALCIALTKKGAQLGNAAFKNRLVTKHYLGLVRGHVDPQKHDGLQINIGIGKDTSYSNVYRMCIEGHPSCEAPRNALTTVCLLEHGEYDGEPASLLLLIPHTGRTHQLRVHCAHIGHKIVGDYTYSNRTDVKPYRMMLHAYRLIIPTKIETINITSPSPFTSERDPLWSVSQTFLTYEEYLQRNESDALDTNIHACTKAGKSSR